MKLRLKYVGIGLFLAGLLFSLNSEFDIIASGLPTETSNEKVVENKDKNHTEIEENEAQENNASNSNNSSSEAGKNGTDQNSVNNSNTEKGNSVVTTTVIIYEDMSLYEIGQQVEDLNLIENGRQLELYLSKPEYARSVQKGSFELSSDMTLEEMANLLTAKKKQ